MSGPWDPTAFVRMLSPTLKIPLFWDRPPLNMNQRLHWGAKAKLTKMIRAEVCTLALSTHQTFDVPVEVELVWTVTDKRRRDTDNPAPTLKACIDGLRDAGVIPEDHSGVVTRSGTRIVLGTTRGLQLEVRAS